MPRKRSIPAEIFVLLGAFILFIPFIGAIHLFDWDEINFAESAREMILTGDYLTVRVDFLPFWEKPPLFIWMQVLAMKLFGINEFAARFPNVICGMLTLLVLFRTGRRVYDSEFAWFWVLAYTGSFLPFLYFKSGLIDPWFNLFIFAALLSLILFLNSGSGRRRWTCLVVSALLLGLANLTKGPVSVLIFILTVFIFWALNGFRMKIRSIEIAAFILIMALVGGSWYLLQVFHGRHQIITDFIQYQVRLLSTEDAGHAGFPLFHPVALLVGVFPASVFALKGFRRSYYDNSPQKQFKLWMIILVVVVLVVFSIVRTKIVHYSSLAYLPLTYLGAYVIYKIIHGRIKNYRWLNTIYAILGVIIGIVASVLPFLMKNKEILFENGLITDMHTMASLRQPVQWSGSESLIGMVFISGTILSLVLMSKRKQIAYAILLLNMTLFINMILFFTAGRIEGYAQNALIRFCKERQNEDCYILPAGMKTYAHLFYASKPVPEHGNSSDQDWLGRGEVDKPVYFILRNKNAEEYLEYYPEFNVFYEAGGFVFCRRNPPQPSDD